MILHLSPHAPMALRILADAALVIHIGGAATALVSGPVAMIARKGGLLHRIAGTVFFVAMLGMSSVGAFIAPLLNDPISGLAGTFTFYLVVTGWVAVWRKDGKVGRFEIAALIYALTVAMAGMILGELGSEQPHGLLGGEPFQIAFGFAAIAGLAGACDLTILMNRGVAGARRIARHLWRMGLALFITAGSFAGQPKAQPEFLRGSPFLIVPALIMLAATLYWLIKVQLPARRRTAPASHTVLSVTP